MQREIAGGFVLDVTYVGRRGLYLQRERNINQLAEGTLQRTPASTSRPCGRTSATARCASPRTPARSIYNSLQLSADKRYANGLKVGAAYTLGHSEDNASDKRNVLWNTYDDTNFWGAVELRPPTRAERLLHLRPAVLARAGHAHQEPAGGWQISGSSFFRTGTPFSITRTNDIAGVGDGGNGQPVDLVGDINANANGKFSDGAANDDNFIFNPAAFANPAAGKFGNSTAQHPPQPGGSAVGPGDLQELRARRHAEAAVPRGDVQLHQSPEPERRRTPTSRALTSAARRNKDGNRRDIQLALRYMF